MNKQKGFTLIELLVVIGIIAILAIGALIAINPIEAQRKARDSVRIQDMQTLEAAIETYVNDNGFPQSTVYKKNSSGVNVKVQDCANNWTGFDLCPYLKQVPVDPQNGKTISIAVTSNNRAAKTANFGLEMDPGTGKISVCTYLEADSSVNTLKSDINPSDDVFQAGTNTTCKPG